MRIVLDTNVLFAAFIRRGACALLYEQVLASATLITSKPILSEFEAALCAKAKVLPTVAFAARHQIEANAVIVVPTQLPAAVSRDPMMI